MPTCAILRLRHAELVALWVLLASGCIIAEDEPEQPVAPGDTDSPSAYEVCELAIAAVASSCDPPTTPFVELAGGGVEYSVIDDPAAAGGVGILGGFLIQANASASADYYGRVIISNGVCQVACIYPCSATNKDLCSVGELPDTSPACFLCKDDISEQGCQGIIESCLGAGAADDTGTTEAESYASSSGGAQDETTASSMSMGSSGTESSSGQ